MSERCADEEYVYEYLMEGTSITKSEAKKALAEIEIPHLPEGERYTAEQVYEMQCDVLATLSSSRRAELTVELIERARRFAEQCESEGIGKSVTLQ